MKLIFFMATVLTFCSVITSGYNPCSRNSYTCPDVRVLEDLKDPNILKRYERDYVKKVWASSAILYTSRLHRELRNIMTLLADSDSIRLSHIAFMHATWMATIFSNLEEMPSLCLMAKVVNASVEYAENNAVIPAAASLNLFPNTVGTICKQITRAILVRMKCDSIPDADGLTGKCYKRGHVYNLAGLWQYYGDVLPCRLKKVLWSLYSSSNFWDQVQGALAAMSITPIFHDIHSAHPQDSVIESLDLLVRSQDISKCCCGEIIAKSEILCNTHVNRNKENVAILIESKYSEPKCEKNEEKR